MTHHAMIESSTLGDPVQNVKDEINSGEAGKAGNTLVLKAGLYAL